MPEPDCSRKRSASTAQNVCQSFARRPFTHALVHNCTQLPSHTLWGSPQEAAPTLLSPSIPPLPPVPRGMYRGKSGRCVVCVSLVPAPPPPPPRDTARRRQTKQSGGVAGLICANLSEDLGCFLSMFRCENVCACE